MSGDIGDMNCLEFTTFKGAYLEVWISGVMGKGATRPTA